MNCENQIIKTDSLVLENNYPFDVCEIVSRVKNKGKYYYMTFNGHKFAKELNEVFYIENGNPILIAKL